MVPLLCEGMCSVLFTLVVKVNDNDMYILLLASICAACCLKALAGSKL